MNDAYEPLREIMRQFGATGPAEEFYWAVNEAFHGYEASRYDDLYSWMYLEEPPVWKRLLQHLPPAPERLTFLDIGCGTGLVEHFLNDRVPRRVACVTLLDPSRAMLDAVMKKAHVWAFPCAPVQGSVDAMAGRGPFDVITVNSVLHHVVELEKFCQAVEGLLAPGGLLLTAQDPASAAATDEECLRRRRRALRRRRFRPGNLLRAVARRLTRPSRGLTQIEKETSGPLMAKKVITRPMDEASICAVTDFHVPGQPGNLGSGIDPGQLGRWMPRMKSIAVVSYAFHGPRWTALTDGERRKEREWLESGDPHGSQIATVWQRG